MTKSELVNVLAEAGKMSKINADNAMDALLKAIYQTERTIIKGFGTFEWKAKKAYIARNPNTGEKVNVPEKRKLCFRASKSS